jgi:hypothetical protein
MTKTLNQIFFILRQNQNIFSATLGIRSNINFHLVRCPILLFLKDVIGCHYYTHYIIFFFTSKLRVKDDRSTYVAFMRLFTAERKLQNDKISTADQQINSAFNGFNHIYLPLSFIEVIKCTCEFLPHQRKFVNDIHRWLDDVSSHNQNGP